VPRALPLPAARRTFLKNTQARLDKGKLRLEDLLGFKGRSKGGSMLDHLQEVLSSSGQITKVGGRQAGRAADLCIAALKRSGVLVIDPAHSCGQA
jgi:hypothetical protein